MKVSPELTPELVPCVIRDANGNTIQYVKECDTETGVCVCYSTDEDGVYITDFGEIATKIVLAKAPLTIHPVHLRR